MMVRFRRIYVSLGHNELADTYRICFCVPIPHGMAIHPCRAIWTILFPWHSICTCLSWSMHCVCVCGKVLFYFIHLFHIYTKPFAPWEQYDYRLPSIQPRIIWAMNYMSMLCLRDWSWMFVCVCVVVVDIDSRVCCLAAPGDHESANFKGEVSLISGP